MSDNTAPLTANQDTNPQQQQHPQQQQQSLLLEQHPIPLPSSIPKSLTRSFVVYQISTDIVVQIFADRIFLGVSQLQGGKIGTYIMCEAETSQTNLRQTEYFTSSLLGNRTDDSMVGVYARTCLERIRAVHNSTTGASSNSGAAENIGTNDDGAMPTVLLLGISLDKNKGTDPNMFRALVDIMVDMYVDAIRDSP